MIQLLIVELSFVGIRQKLTEIWLFANEFQNKNFG